MHKIIYNKETKKFSCHTLESTKGFARKDYEGLTHDDALDLSRYRKELAETLWKRRQTANRILDNDVHEIVKNIDENKDPRGNSYYKDLRLNKNQINRNIRENKDLDRSNRAVKNNKIEKSFRDRNRNYREDLDWIKEGANRYQSIIRNNQSITNAFKKKVHNYNPKLDPKSVQYKYK